MLAGVKAPAFIREGQELPHSLTHPHVRERCSQSRIVPCIDPAPVWDAAAVKLINAIKASLLYIGILVRVLCPLGVLLFLSPSQPLQQLGGPRCCSQPRGRWEHWDCMS